jgi:hypothetical protein
VRDALERSVGFGPVVNIWEMAVTTLFGVVLLWYANGNGVGDLLWPAADVPGSPPGIRIRDPFSLASG